MKSNMSTQKMTCKDMYLAKQSNIDFKDQLSICKNVPSCHSMLALSRNPFTQNIQMYVEKFKTEKGISAEKFCKSQNFDDKVIDDICVSILKNPKSIEHLQDKLDKMFFDLGSKCKVDLGVKK
jgi:hypothetical protein